MATKAHTVVREARVLVKLLGNTRTDRSSRDPIWDVVAIELRRQLPTSPHQFWQTEFIEWDGPPEVEATDG